MIESEGEEGRGVRGGDGVGEERLCGVVLS